MIVLESMRLALAHCKSESVVTTAMVSNALFNAAQEAHAQIVRSLLASDKVYNIVEGGEIQVLVPSTKAELDRRVQLPLEV